MEKFMFLFMGGDAGTATLSPEDAQKYMQKWNAWVKDLSQKGVFVAGEPLKAGGKRVVGSKKVITDGPFTGSKEMVGGYFIINAQSIDDAVEISKDCPVFDHDGTVEVRQVMTM